MKTRMPIPLSQIPLNPIVIIADPNTIFTKIIAMKWKERGFDVVIITTIRNSTYLNNNGIFVLSVQDYEGPFWGSIRLSANIVLGHLEAAIRLPKTKQQKSYLMKGGTVAVPDSEIMAFKWFTYGFAISRLARRLKPQFVYGMQALLHSFAVSLCGNVPKVIFPFGGDIYEYANQSRYVGTLMANSLRRVDLVLPSAKSSVKYLIERFDLVPNKVKAISWGVDGKLFYPRSAAEKNVLKEKYRIDPNKKVIVNVRRFNLAWGSQIVLDVFMEIAARDKNTHFIIIPGQKENIDDAIRAIDEAGLQKSFTVFTEYLDLASYAEVISSADIFVSFMLKKDMRSASILQATACGCVPILSAQDEYGEMINEGFKAILVPFGDKKSAEQGILRYLQDEPLMLEVRINNLEYIEKLEVMDELVDEMLTTILPSYSVTTTEFSH